MSDTGVDTGVGEETFGAASLPVAPARDARATRQDATIKSRRTSHKSSEQEGGRESVSAGVKSGRTWDRTRDLSRVKRALSR